MSTVRLISGSTFGVQARFRLHLGLVNTLIQGFVVGNWLSFGHYLFANPVDVLPRINAIIAIQTVLASALFVYSLWMQVRFHPDSLPYFRRIWIKLVAFYGITIFALEWAWPSDFQTWWL